MADQENLPLLRFHPEIIVPQILGVQTAFIPPIQDLNDPMALLLINEGARGFFSLIAGVALYFNLLKDPFPFQRISPQSHRGLGEKIRLRFKKQNAKWKLENNIIFNLPLFLCFLCASVVKFL
jgi:hypothetical protein